LQGSTSAFAESILRTAGCYTGLFTSPHLVDIRERFRLRGEPISEELFVKHFWTVWNALKVTNRPRSPAPARLSVAQLMYPRSFRHSFSMYQSSVGFNCPYSNRPSKALTRFIGEDRVCLVVIRISKSPINLIVRSAIELNSRTVIETFLKSLLNFKDPSEFHAY
jgi:hypothetical protein